MNDLIPIIAASPLRQRLIDDMTMRRFSRETQRNYIRDVGRFATWLGRSPHIAMAEDLRRFQIEPQEADVPVPTMNSVVIRHGSFLIAPAATSHRGTEGPTSSMRKSGLRPAKIEPSAFEQLHRRPKSGRFALKTVCICAASISLHRRAKSKSP